MTYESAHGDRQSSISTAIILIRNEGESLEFSHQDILPVGSYYASPSTLTIGPKGRNRAPETRIPG
jgi:hypothetical protein